MSKFTFDSHFYDKREVLEALRSLFSDITKESKKQEPLPPSSLDTPAMRACDQAYEGTMTLEIEYRFTKGAPQDRKMKDLGPNRELDPYFIIDKLMEYLLDHDSTGDKCETGFYWWLAHKEAGRDPKPLYSGKEWHERLCDGVNRHRDPRLEPLAAYKNVPVAGSIKNEKAKIEVSHLYDSSDKANDVGS